MKIVLKGVRQAATENDADIFLFLNYTVVGETEENNIGESNIFRLSDVQEFDGYILLANTFHLKEEFDYVTQKFVGKDMPVISLEYDIPGIDFMGSDNYSGMYELCEHLIEDHGVKDVVFVSGPVDNEESNTRRKALEDALEKRGLSLKEENVLCCNWNITEVEELLPIWMKDHDVLPDAVVCANDMMAMGACTVFDRQGYEVPKDVIVTGFDHLKTADAFSPSIASVGRNWETLGYKAVEYVLGKKDGTKKGDGVLSVDSKAVPNESCGCFGLYGDAATKIAEVRNSYNMYLSRANIGIHVCYLSDNLSKAVTEEQLCQAMNGSFWNRAYEGDEFYICLVENFFSSVQGGPPLKRIGYTDTIDVIYGRKDDIPYKRTLIDASALFPEYDPEGKETKMFILLPLHGEEGCYGYTVFCNEIDMLYDYTLYSWIRHMNMNMRHIRRGIVMNQMNTTLEKLSVTDALTGVYNRMGCDKKAYPYLEECHRQGKMVALMFADINKMKLINDNYGHLQGDIAICTVAEAIVDVLKDEWIVVRYGGDEFLMVGECEDESLANEKINEIAAHLEEVKKTMQLPYNLKVSFGHMMIRPEEDLDMSECLTRAEDEMYAMKKRLHAEMEVNNKSE